jgi:hypothetical protein
VLFRQPETALITHYPPDFELADHETALDGMTDGVIADVNAIPLRKGVISAQGASPHYSRMSLSQRHLPL